MILLDIYDTTLPLTNPILKFLVILLIILFAPLLLNKLRIPHLLGLIIAGAIIGPHSINLLERDSSIILSGTAGLLYIMFLAGLEIDLNEFKKNSSKSLVFGLYTFSIPMGIGLWAALYLLHFSMLSSILLASMFASHTLIAYPLISKLGVAKNRAVQIAVGGTMITDILALLVLAVIVKMTTGEVNAEFWTRLTASVMLFGATVLLGFPVIGRWFFKRYDDSVSQYIFVLSMVFLGAVMAELAGVEAIIGAFLAGLSLNRLVPQTSALMNRIEFVGNAIFIPFFLIGVGMLVDFESFVKDKETILVAVVMTVVATFSKFVAAWLAQKTYRMSADERRLIFGLSNAQAAATLAAVLVGYNIIIGLDANGDPVRLLSESVLNGTILMILVTCTIATFVAQRGAKNIALLESSESEEPDWDFRERILIPVSNADTTEELVNLSITIKSPRLMTELYALSVVNNAVDDAAAYLQAQKILDKASRAAAATDNTIRELLRYDLNLVNGISSVVKEQKITDIILGLHHQKGLTDSFLGNLTEGILTRCNTTTLIYKAAQPLSTVKRHLILLPEHAEREIGFPFWLVKVWNIARNTGARLVFYARPDTLACLKNIHSKHAVDSSFISLQQADELLTVKGQIQRDDNLMIIMSREDRLSYQEYMAQVPVYLNEAFKAHSFILVYPMQAGVSDLAYINLKNPSIHEPIERLDEIGRTIARLFKRR
jgi:Kef-type K+ transport system membrane component KefB/nucleotide-binding universal stress UspA family protein